MIRTCAACGDRFELRAQHVGYSNKCAECNTGDVERTGAKVMWTGKHTMEIELAPLQEAMAFNRKNARIGASVLRQLVPRVDTPFGRGDRPAKEEHANNPGATYTSSLGEKHHTKR